MSHRERFFDTHLVRGLSRKQAELLLAAGEVEALPGDTLVVAEGDVVACLHVLLDGEVEVFLPRTEQRISAVHLNVLSVLDCFGEYTFIDHQPASASIRTRADAVLYRIEHDRLHAMLSTHADIGCIVYRNLLKILVKRLRASNAELDLFTLPD